MKKFIVIAVAVIAVVAMFGIMQRNKTQNQAKAKSVEKLTVFPVSVEQAKKEKIDEKLSIIGTVFANSEVNVVSEAQGRVTAVNFDIGQRISKGAELVKLDDELKNATLSSAQANYEKAKKDLDRYTQLVKEKTVNEVQYEQAKLAYATCESQLVTAKRQYNDTRIKSPINGIVTARNIEVGSFLNVGNPVAYVVDISSLKIKINVPEKDVFKMKEGEEVDIVTDIYQGMVFKGKIKNISAKADEAHTYPVEVALKNDNSKPLRAGMFARVIFNSIKKSEAIIIPRTALIGSAKDPQIYVVNNNTAYLRKITIGLEAGDKIEVISGINPGDMVVTNGQVNLQDNVQVKIIE